MPTTTAARHIEISNWCAHSKGTLRGFFSVTLPSGMVINDCMLHQKNDARWIGLPAKPYEDKNNEKKWAIIVTFVDQEAEYRFRDQVLAALDQQQPWKEVR